MVSICFHVHPTFSFPGSVHKSVPYVCPETLLVLWAVGWAELGCGPWRACSMSAHLCPWSSCICLRRGFRAAKLFVFPDTELLHALTDRGLLGCPQSSVSLTHWDSRERECRAHGEAAAGESDVAGRGKGIVWHLIPSGGSWTDKRLREPRPLLRPGCWPRSEPVGWGDGNRQSARGSLLLL